MKYNLDDSVLHPDFGGGVVIKRFMSASGVNEIYIVTSSGFLGLSFLSLILQK